MKLLLALLLLPVTAFATITATDRGTGTDAGSSTTTVITLPTMTAGNTGILCIAMDNANASGSNLGGTGLSAGYYDDSVGNRWYVRSNSSQAATANGIQELWILESRLTTSISSSNSLTITFAVASPSEAWTFTEASTDISGAVVVYETSGVATTSTATGAPTITTGLEPTNTDLVIGCGAAEGTAGGVDTWVGATDATNGSWSTKQSAGAGSGLTGMAVISQAKVVNASGVISYAPTLTSCDVRLGWIILQETDPKVRSVSGNSTSNTSISIPVNYPISAGSLAVLCVAADNAGGASINLPSTVTDGGSNTWTQRQFGVYNLSGAQSGTEFAIYTGAIATGIGPGSSLTVATAASSIPSKAWVLWEFAPVGAGTVTYVSGSNGGGGTTGAPVLNVSVTTSGNYVVAMGAAEGISTWAPDTDTLDGTWKTRASAAKGAGLAAQSIISQWKKTTGTSTQVYTPTLTSADTIMGGIEINDSSPTGPTVQQKAGFFMFFP